MTPSAKSSIPRPSGEIKVRKRRDNRSSTSSLSGASYPQSSPTFSTRRSSPLKASLKPAPSPVDSAAVLHRRTSSRNKVFSKVLGSLQSSKSSLGQTPVRNGQSDGGLLRKLSMRRRPSFQARARSSELPIPSSTPSSRATLRPDQTCIGSDDPFPRRSSPSSSDQAAPRPAGVTPGPPPILTVDLNMVTEVGALSLYEERTIWVAVQACGVVKANDNRDEGTGLDVVLILDNSRFASPNCLENACDVALRIVQMSAASDDRVAIFCTCCRHFSTDARSSGCLLHPLRAANLAAIQREINDIRALAPHPPATDADLAETLREAIKVLTEPNGNVVEPIRRDRSQIFVLSPHPLVSEDEFAPIKVNMVCTALVPYHHGATAASDVWMLPMMLPLELNQYENVNRDSDHLVAQVADVLSYARRGCASGDIKGLQLDIGECEGCVVESILGRTSSRILRAGQTISALVRVRVPAALSASRKERPASSICDLDDAFAELAILLGETMTELFTVKAHYKQSLFPDNNTVTVESTCCIRRPNPLSQWSVGPRNDHSLASPAELELYKRFVFFIATQDPPQAALDTLATFYENKHCSLPCSGYIDRVRQELAHQMETILHPTGSSVTITLPRESFELPQLKEAPEPSELPTTPKTPNSRPQPRHFPSHPHFSFEPHDSLRFTATFTPAPEPAPRSVSASVSPLTNIRRRSPHPSVRKSASDEDGNSAHDEADSSSIDEARAIWRHMRRKVSMRSSSPTRGTPSWPTGYRKAGQRQEAGREQREKELKRKALVNKRSIGADTLRSLAMSSEAVGSEARVAPWM